MKEINTAFLVKKNNPGPLNTVWDSISTYSLWPGFLNYLIGYCDPNSSGITNGSMAVFDFLSGRYESPDRFVKGKVNEHFIRPGSLHVHPWQSHQSFENRKWKKNKKKLCLKTALPNFDTALKKRGIHGTFCCQHVPFHVVLNSLSLPVNHE